MTRERITLSGDDAEWFRDIRQTIAKRRDGYQPTNAEVARLMMEDYDDGHSARLG